MPTYIAFLRGINVGGNHKVPMVDLKKTLESLGYKNVQTVLASGNVSFQTTEKNTTTVAKKIETELKKVFKFEIPTLLYPLEEIQNLFDANPFKKITVTKETRLYITFLRQPTKTKLTLPWKSPASDFEILSVTPIAVCSVLTLNPATRSVDSMKILEQEFSKDVTTRNWNTIEKILQKANN